MLRAMTCVASCHFYLQQFYKYASAKRVELPKIRANAQDAFVGWIPPEYIKSRPLAGQDHRSMKNQTFFAAPLIVNREYYKYSGARSFSRNGEEQFGPAVDVFAHFVLVHSNTKTILCDLQGMKLKDELVLFDPQICT
ncbi:hypothetical protein K439DRAFT_322461 [Ramaria rubella]|nr:hypothetical protein K439DRAFT_322461 [Ramaria rubella]